MKEHEIQTEGCPEFTDWKGRLGWTFTADECRKEWQAKQDAKEFMENYFVQPLYAERMFSRVFKTSFLSENPEKPEDMKTEDAEIYLGRFYSKLRQGVKDGWLHPFKKKLNGDNRHRWNYYLTSELDAYKEHLNQLK